MRSTIQTLLRTWSRTEVWSALVGVLSLVVSVVANMKSDSRSATVVLLACVATAACLWFLFLISRDAFSLRGYSNVMSYLESLAETARYRVWTARTHLGEGVGEHRYFGIIEHRLKSPYHPLEDFRRVVRLSPKARDHISWLVSHFYNQTGVEVRYFEGGGPQFDFVIVDGKVAVIGFPMAGGKGNVGAVVLRRRSAVEGVETVFNALWDQAQVLFEGSADSTSQTQLDLQVKFDAILTPPGAVNRLGYPHDAHGHKSNDTLKSS